MADIIGNKPGTPGSPKKRVTVSADRENRSPSSADYRKPIVRSAVRRWKKLHEQNMMQKLVGLRNEKKQSVKISRESARKIARKIPTEMLAKEWLNDNEATLEVRAYLVDRVLPTLILGVEKLLNEAHDRGLTEANESDANFNPLNMLASYLMRNNPKYSNFSESSPYVRGLREVAEELKRQLFNIEDNRLARIKAEARRRREERDKQERLKQLEQERRERAFMDQFAEWNIQHDGRVELALVQNALRSFVEIAENFPEEWANSSRLSRALEPTDESGKALTVKEFAKYLGLYIEDFSKEIFDEFMVHLSKCAKFHKTAANQEARRILLTNLFISCDHSGIGLLDRHRILSLFEKFWDAMKEDVKHNLRNPRRWPVVEVDEAIDFDDDDDDDDDEANDLVEKSSEPMEQKAKPVTPAQKDKVEEKQKEDTDKTDGKQTQENLTEKPEIENVQKTESEEAKKTEEKVDESQKEAQKSSDKADEESKKEEAVEEKPKEAEKKDDKEEKAKEEEKVQKESTEAAAEKKKEEKPAEKEEAKPGEIKMEVKVDAKEEEKKEEAKGGEIKMEVKMDAKEEEKKEEAKTEETKKEDKTETKEKVEEKSKEEESKGQDKSEAKKDEDDKKDAEEKKDEVAKAESEEKPEDKGKPLGEAPSSKVDSSKTEGEKEENDENKDKPADAPAADKTEVSEGGDKAASSTQPQEPASEGPKEGNQPAEDKPSSDKPVEEAKETAAPEVPSTDKDTAVAAEPAGKLEVPKTPKASDGQQEQLSVTFAEGTAFEREKTAMTTLSKTSGASAFDENSLNVSQFVQLTETFLGEDPVNKQTFDSLARSIKEGYEETEEEKMERLMKARKEALSSQRKQQMDALFEKWDNDGAGYLDLDEVETVMQKYKEGQEIEAIERAKHSLKKQAKYAQDNRLSRREFRQFITLVTNEMPGADNFDYFVEFLVNSVERTYAERIRGEARKKWLQQVVSAAETSGASLEPVYKAVFSALYKDAEAHGGGKRVSANISMLERNCTAPGRGDVCLRYVAATVDDADFLLGKILYKDMKGISFAAVESGKPIHVPRVNNHGNLHFWNPYRVPEDREGSFIVVPLQDRKKRVFGLLGVDTLNDRHTKTIFITHEIMFFQGVSKSFSIAYHYIDMRKKLLRITESAVSWIHRRSPHVQEVVTYMVESDGNEKDKDYVLRKMMVTDPKGNVVNINNPPRLERKDNLFRDYLFRCVDNSENVSADAYGQRHIGFPLRDDQGRAVAVVDISIGELKALPSHENKEVQRMLRLLQLAHKEITRESAGDEKMAVLEGEKDEDNRMDIMFDRLMLIELRENVSKIDAKSFAEIKSYNDPPPIVGDIVKAVCAIFYLDKAESGELDNWGALRALINQELLQKIEHYDPTSAANLVPPEKIEVYLKDVPHGEVGKFGSIPAQNLYNWVFVCLSLIEHTLKMRQNTNEGAVTPANK